MATPVEVRKETREATAPWSLPHRILFRFVFCYLVLYMLPTGPGRVDLVNAIPGGFYVAQRASKPWHALIPWVAIHVFHLSGAQ